MCSNNLRDGVFDAYAVDPNNPHTESTSLAEDHLTGLLLPAVRDIGLLLPAAQDTGLLLPAVQGRPTESWVPTDQFAFDHGFALMV
jgi:hypothetical protein